MSSPITKVRLRRSHAGDANEEPRKSARIVERANSTEPPVPTADDVASMGRAVLERVTSERDQRDDGLLADPFFKLPSQRQYPEYYVVIRRPISLAEVRQKLKQKEYAFLQDFKQDLELMCTNAKRFNVRDSDIWLKARDLHSLVKDACAEAYDEWLSHADQRLEKVPMRSHKITLRAPRSSTVEAPVIQTDKKTNPATTDAPMVSSSSTSAPSKPEVHASENGSKPMPAQDSAVAPTPGSAGAVEVASAAAPDTSATPEAASPHTPATPAKMAVPSTSVSQTASPGPAEHAEQSASSAPAASTTSSTPHTSAAPAKTTTTTPMSTASTSRPSTMTPGLATSTPDSQRTYSPTVARIIESASQPNQSPTVPSPTTASYLAERRRRGAPRGKRLKAMLRWAVQNMVAAQDLQGHAYSEMFMELPSRDEYPDYYQFIRQPLCFADIERKLDLKEYINPHALVSDIRLMLSNAQFYNEEGSQIWNDAQALWRHLDNVLIPGLLAEGFTLDPNDHRQAALPPGTPGAVPPPPPSVSAQTPPIVHVRNPMPTTSTTATPLPAKAPTQSHTQTADMMSVQTPGSMTSPIQMPISRMPMAGPKLMPKQMPSAPEATSSASASASASVAPFTTTKATVSILGSARPAGVHAISTPTTAAAVPSTAVPLDRVIRDMDSKTWPPHPTAFLAPDSCMSEKESSAGLATHPLPPWTSLHVYTDGDKSQAHAHIRLDTCPSHALALPPGTRSTQWRWIVDKDMPQAGVRVLLDGLEAQGHWDGSSYAVTWNMPAGEHVLEALWFRDNGSPAGRAHIYIHSP